MDYEKIGEFIAKLRKEHGMTQQQLADNLGVSNKAISKWECGKGMPEISIIVPLSQVLEISINELLAGEYLSPASYSSKAEENMIQFIKNAENSNKKNNLISMIMISVTTIFITGFTIFSSAGISMCTRIFDIQTLLCMFIITILSLLGSKCWTPFLKVFFILLDEKKVFSEKELLKSKIAIKLISNLWLLIGVLFSCIRFVSIIYVSNSLELVLEALNYSLPLVMSSLLYGLIGYLILLPIYTKLEIINIELFHK